MNGSHKKIPESPAIVTTHKKISKSPAIVTTAQEKSESPAIVTTAQEKSQVASHSDEQSRDASDYNKKIKAMKGSKQAKDVRGRGNWWVVSQCDGDATPVALHGLIAYSWVWCGFICVLAALAVCGRFLRQLKAYVNSGTKECSHSSFVFFLYLLVSYYSII
jgi:hypothetical protein